MYCVQIYLFLQNLSMDGFIWSKCYKYKPSVWIIFLIQGSADCPLEPSAQSSISQLSHCSCPVPVCSCPVPVCSCPMDNVPVQCPQECAQLMIPVFGLSVPFLSKPGGFLMADCLHKLCYSCATVVL